MSLSHSSIPNQKGKIEYNQSYISGDYCFVFNGMLRGIRIKKKVEGEIGAQKIWSLLQKKLRSKKPERALKKLHEFLKKTRAKLMVAILV